ncbi:unnamed protein product [Phyllotreta striolata]|uniref:Uncharacterized protein n=1 Tax=Phyllotreta striolata TaxID=444603 RepID=A0A9N9TB67_PHYSR|nr:unnamed protein product [Phyllotreta striolata]
MWSSVAPENIKSPAPSARSKHSATLVGEFVYILGGRNGNLPTKDFWKYNLVTGKWHQVKPVGDKLPCLQEHTAIAYRDSIYVFGGEVGFSNGTETPLWVYDIKLNSWKKKKAKKGVSTPKGRRGHTALVYNGSMLIYGGYQDLKGSTNELWAYHFETDSWHLISTAGRGSDQTPPPRHKHSAILQGDAMWIYGGMTDLQERSDLWKWDVPSRTWHCVKCKINPGPLHSHAATKLPTSHMLVFGGERNGQASSDLWKFSFALETWEKITINASAKPQPRSESIAIIISELLLNGSSTTSFDSKSLRIRTRTCTSADRSNRHSSYLPNNKVAPCEQTFVFHATQNNYTDGSDLAQQFSETNRSSRSFLQEIQKLSQLNIPRMSNKCSYTVLTGCAGDSTESLLRQHASPQTEIEVIDTDIDTPRRGSMIKSKSAYVIKKKYNSDASPSADEEQKETVAKKRVEFDSTATKIPREPISVPNFSVLTLPTPVLTPVEASKLVYLDSEDENDLLGKKSSKPSEKLNGVQANNEQSAYDGFKPIKKGESYSSHIGYADNPLYQEMIKSLEEKSRENVSSTSDYASIETVNRLSSASSYSVKTGTPQDENARNVERDRSGPFGFCNPNYMGPDIRAAMSDNKPDRKGIVKLLSTEEHCISDDDNALEMQSYNGTFSRNTKVVFRHSSRTKRPPPQSLAIDKGRSRSGGGEKCRAHSAGRAENKVENAKHEVFGPGVDPALKVYLYIFGGKEQGQVTVFQRPISIWRLKLF